MYNRIPGFSSTATSFPLPARAPQSAPAAEPGTASRGRGSGRQLPPGPPGCAADAARVTACGQASGHPQSRAVEPAGQEPRGNHRHVPGRSRPRPEAGEDMSRQHNRIIRHRHKLRPEQLPEPLRHRQDCVRAAAEADVRTSPRVIRTTGTATAAVLACGVRRPRAPSSGRALRFARRSRPGSTADPHGGPSTGPAPRHQRGTGRRAARPAVGHPGHLSTSTTTAGEHPLIDAAAQPAARERGRPGGVGRRHAARLLSRAPSPALKSHHRGRVTVMNSAAAAV